MIDFKFQRGKDLRPFNTKWWAPTQKQWAPVLLKLQGPYWKREVEPTYQRPWARLSPAYKKWKDKRYPNEPILRATGKMQDTAKIKPQGQGFEVKTTKYGPYHQFGTSKMPARPWMGIPDDSLKAIVPIAWKNILSRKK